MDRLIDPFTPHVVPDDLLGRVKLLLECRDSLFEARLPGAPARLFLAGALDARFRFGGNLDRYLGLTGRRGQHDAAKAAALEIERQRRFERW